MIRQIGPVNYVLQKSEKSKPIVVHVNKLKDVVGQRQDLGSSQQLPVSNIRMIVSRKTLGAHPSHSHPRMQMSNLIQMFLQIVSHCQLVERYPLGVVFVPSTLLILSVNFCRFCFFILQKIPFFKCNIWMSRIRKVTSVTITRSAVQKPLRNIISHAPICCEESINFDRVMMLLL